VDVAYAEVLAAAERIAPHLPTTPAWSYPLLDEVVGSCVVVKHENAQPTGAFKVRGGAWRCSCPGSSVRPAW